MRLSHKTHSTFDARGQVHKAARRNQGGSSSLRFEARFPR